MAITGCMYAFQEEIKAFYQPYIYVEPQQKAFLPPSQLREIADAQVPGKHIHGILYKGKHNAVNAIYYMEDEYYDFVYLNPYTGEVLKVKNELTDFFRFVLNGHFYLWLPHDIGRPVVASFTLIFIVMLISGIVLWWPKNKFSIKQRFTVKWDARWRRKNYDLHNVTGFYICWLALIFAVTGLVWGFEWFAKGYYGIASGGKKLLPYDEPLSDYSARNNSYDMPVIDKLWYKMQEEHPEAKSIEMHFPHDDKTSIMAAINPEESTYYKTDHRYFDQYTMAELSVDHQWGRYLELSAANKLMRMNYDIHVGAILGLPGKILAFFISLLIASLPVSGFMIWYGRRNKEKKAPAKSINKVIAYSEVRSA